MTRWLSLAFVGLFTAVTMWGAPSAAQAQQDLLVLIVDPGSTQLNQPRLTTAIQRSTQRTIIRMTDERAPMANGRLTIAFSRPNRWVLRYESGGQVAWVSDRIERPGEIRDRLAELSLSVVSVIDRPPTRPAPSAPSAAAPPSTRPRTRGSWDDEVILALRDEIIDPFAEEHPRRARPVALLWSEVVDPFADSGSRSRTRQVWSEVLDPWATEVRRGRR